MTDAEYHCGIFHGVPWYGNGRLSYICSMMECNHISVIFENVYIYIRFHVNQKNVYFVKL